MKFVSAEQLSEVVGGAFVQAGMTLNDAQAATRVLIWASLRGVDTHGVRNLVPYYLDKIGTGEINARPNVQPLFKTNSVIRFDGDRGSGLVTAGIAMNAAIDRANANGVGIATVENTHHLGPAGYFAQLALGQDMLGFCTTGHFFGNGFHTGVAPIGGKLAMLSTNPISFAAPAKDYADFLLDMSTATATVNRIEQHGQAGEPIPEGWAKDCEGHPTTDPQTARVLYALGGESITGGHKGVALSMMVSVLTGVLTGAWKQAAEAEIRPYDQPTMGHCVAAVRIDQFMPVEQFKLALDAMLEAVVACPVVEGASDASIEYPGSQEKRNYDRRLKQGIPLDDRLYDELRSAIPDLEA